MKKGRRVESEAERKEGGRGRKKEEIELQKMERSREMRKESDIVYTSLISIIPHPN